MAQVRQAAMRQRSQAQALSDTALRQEIARVAYELFERRGGAHGHDQQDWFEAEQLVRRRQEWR